MSILRPRSDEGKTVLWCCFGAALSWVLFSAMAGLSQLTGCEPNEAFAGACMALGINWMPTWSMIAIVIAICAFLMAPILILVAIASTIICLLRREW